MPHATRGTKPFYVILFKAPQVSTQQNYCCDGNQWHWLILGQARLEDTAQLAAQGDQEGGGEAGEKEEEP